LNDGWVFHRGEAAGAEDPAYDDSAWQAVRIPHDWSIDGPFDRSNYIPRGYIANHLEGHADSFLPKGLGWYRRALRRGELGRNAATYIEFEGVFRNSTLWINGVEAGTHPWGYTGFYRDITPLVSGDGETLLAIRVDAREPEGWWYEGSGIYRHVWIISKQPVHILPWGIHVSTPSVSKERASLKIASTVANRSGADVKCRLEHEILSPCGNTVSSAALETVIKNGCDAILTGSCAINRPQLWSVEQPCLYTARTSLYAGGEKTDSVETSFGVRWFEFTPDRGFFLNGKHLQLRGGCIHHDFGGLGCALPDRANEKTVEVLKEMGCNMIRSAHNAASPSLMDACDRHGLLFWAEHRYLGPAEKCGQPLREMIRRDRNHPCIIVWGLANTAGSPDGELTGYLKQLNDIAVEQCPEIPTGVALEGNDGANENGFASVTGIVGYNGGGMGIDDRDHRLYPERRMMITEYSSGSGTRGVYEKVPVKDAGMEEFGDGRTMKRGGSYGTIFSLCASHEKEWEHIDMRPWLAGGLMWSAIEYYGENSGWPFVTSQFGVLDVCRFPKDTFYYYKKMWTPGHVLHVFPHWTWPGREGEPCISSDLMAQLCPKTNLHFYSVPRHV